MKGFLAPLQGLAEYEQICEKSKKNKGILQVSGCLESQKAHLIYGLGQTASRRLILAEDERRAREIYEDYRFLSCEGSAVFPGGYSWESSDPSEDESNQGTSGGKRSDSGHQH